MHDASEQKSTHFFYCNAKLEFVTRRYSNKSCPGVLMQWTLNKIIKLNEKCKSQFYIQFVFKAPLCIAFTISDQKILSGSLLWPKKNKFTISNQKVGWLLFCKTNQRDRQGCGPMKLKLSVADSVKLNFSQCNLKLPRQDLAQLTN
jgi:hypothetical protein